MIADWTPLSRATRPKPGALIALRWQGEYHCATCSASDEVDDEGLHISSPSAGVTWNLDLDSSEGLPSHFIELAHDNSGSGQAPSSSRDALSAMRERIADALSEFCRTTEAGSLLPASEHRFSEHQEYMRRMADIAMAAIWTPSGGTAS